MTYSLNPLWPAKTRPIYHVYTPGREVRRRRVRLISADVALFMGESDVDVALIFPLCIASTNWLIHRKRTRRRHDLPSLEAKD